MLRIGILSNSGPSFREDLSFGISLYGFVYAVEKLSFSRIPDSGFSTPARYVAEIFYRLSQVNGDDGQSATFVFNPFFRLDRLNLAFVIDRLTKFTDSKITVCVDRKRQPIGYFFPAGVDKKKWQHLHLLSTTDGEIDAQMLGLLFDCEARIEILADVVIDLNRNGFAPVMSRTYDWMARRNVGLLQKSSVGLSPPLTAVMPHHAGDVFFLSLATKGADHRLNSITVNAQYVPIVRAVAPDVPVQAIQSLPFLRDPDHPSEIRREDLYFDRIKGDLPEQHMLLYLRPSRGFSHLHFVDHFAFALGRHFFTEGSLLIRNLPFAVQPPSSGKSALKVLLHFDAGWPLKIYPKSWQQTLVDLLVGKGFLVDVLLGSADQLKNCQLHTFKNLDQLSALIRSNDLVIGMDSFPVHWALFEMGKPSICLFGSTPRENVSAPDLVNYLALDKAMPCRPCDGYEACPLYEGSYCHNFSSPEVVTEAAIQIMRRTSLALAITTTVLFDNVTAADFEQSRTQLPRGYLLQRMKMRKLTGFYHWRMLIIFVHRFFATLRSNGLRAALSRVEVFIRARRDRIADTS